MKKILFLLSLILSSTIFCMDEKMEVEPSGEMEVEKDVLVLPVPQAEEPRKPRSIDLNEVYEPLELHEPFKTVIEELKKEGKELFLAETMSHDGSREDYRYYDAAPESIFVEFLKMHPGAHDFVTGKPIEKIYFYIYNPKTEEIKFHKVFKPPFDERKWNILYQEAPEAPDLGALEHLLQELSPRAHVSIYKQERQALDLRYLDLRDENIPADFFTRLAHVLPNLQILDLFNNNLESLPESIGNLANLQELDVSNNRLERLPESIDNLAHLQKLFVTNNRLESLPETIGNLDNLQKLDVSFNHLQPLPENNFQPLPESIGNLDNLQALWASNNHLESLPEETIGNLSHLQVLDVRGNSLESLPETIGNLANLQVLDVRGNSLESLPETIGNLANLQWLYVSNNPHLVISPALLHELENRGVRVIR